MHADEKGNGFANLIESERGWMGRRPGGPKISEGPRVGIALSGGGIRSATFSLGLLQALSRERLLGRADYLSTVSGGSYIGSFFCSLFVPAANRGDGSKGMARPSFDPQDPLGSELGREAVRRLRDMGRYLTPSGTSDAIYAAAIVLRNWLAIQFVLGMLALLALVTMRLIDTLVPTQLAERAGAFSPTLIAVAIAALTLTAASGTAYWMTRRDRVPCHVLLRMIGNPFTIAIALICAALGTTLPGADVHRTPVVVGWLLLQVGMCALGLYGWAEITRGRLSKGVSAHAARVAAEDRVRTLLSKVMAWAMKMCAATIGLALCDALGGVFLHATQALLRASTADIWTLARRAWPVIVVALPPTMSFVATRSLKSRVPPVDPGDASTRRDWMPTLLVLSGIGLIASWLVLWSAASRALQLWPGSAAMPWLALGLAIENVGQAFCMSFLNLSSLSIFYAARLRRAYIGASSYGNEFTSVRVDDPQDAIGLASYYEGAIPSGAPIHLINITIAETIAAGSNLVARDRKGKPLQLSPAGIAWGGDVPGQMGVGGVDRGEDLPLANWIAISGAAVSAAIGAGTSLGTSILATLANVRLGYWWRAPRGGTATSSSSTLDLSKRSRSVARDVSARLGSTVQGHLVQELQGAFDGERRRRWYLTDGGHFENTGIYALLQRKVPFIVASDNGADPRYRMEDVTRLLVRARSDLGAELSFLDDQALAERLGHRSPMLEWIGSFDRLARTGTGAAKGGPIAALADIRYADDNLGTLLLIKPRLTWKEPPEVLAYRMRPGCSEFPQQTTGDQFFDEEQWEAYRRLGEIAGERLFPARRPADTLWTPRDEMTAPRDTRSFARSSQPSPAQTKSPNEPRAGWKGFSLLSWIRRRPALISA